jgi:hypothetical protein
MDPIVRGLVLRPKQIFIGIGAPIEASVSWRCLDEKGSVFGAVVGRGGRVGGRGVYGLS